MQYNFGYEDEPEPEPPPDGTPYPEFGALTIVSPEDDDPDE